MKFNKIDWLEIAELKIKMEKEILAYLNDYCEKNYINKHKFNADNFYEAMENFWSDAWVSFLNKHNTKAIFDVDFDIESGIIIDFQEV